MRDEHLGVATSEPRTENEEPVARMDERTLTALQGSIEKWKAIEAGTGEDLFYRNCPLCKEFMENEDGEECRGCPVSERTGLEACDGSPWVEWNIAQYAVHDNSPRIADTPELKTLARAEREFLESLLPVSPQDNEEAK